MKSICLTLIMFSLLLCIGCRQSDPFNNNDISFNKFTESEILSVQSELTHTPKANVSNGVSLIHFSDIVKRGNKAEITINAKPSTKYTIRVTYSSGVSRSKSLVPQISDKNGYVSWIWTVGAKTKRGSYPVEILCDNKVVLKTTLNVIDE